MKSSGNPILFCNMLLSLFSLQESSNIIYALWRQRMYLFWSLPHAPFIFTTKFNVWFILEEKYFPVLSSPLPDLSILRCFHRVSNNTCTPGEEYVFKPWKISHNFFGFNVEQESSWNCTLPSIEMHQDGCWSPHALVHRHMGSLETDASVWKLPLIFWVRLALRQYFCVLLLAVQQSAKILLSF